MPSHSVSCPAALRRLRTKSIWLLIAAAWSGLLLTAAGCRDTREDANYCKTCSVESADGTGDAEGVSSSGQETVPGASSSSGEPNMSQAPGINSGSVPLSSQQTGQAGTAASPSKGGAGTSTGNAAAGSRASTSPASMRDAGTASAGRDGTGGNSGANDVDQGGRGTAANGGSNGTRDAGMTTTEPPQPDAGHMQPLPCNGTCPAERPVCDESTPTPRCVQCTRDDDHTCIGDTKTCDPTAMKCVQCTLDDARNCGGDTHVCNRNNRCVVCTSDRPESCPLAQPLCEDEKRCVECMPGKIDACIGRDLCSSDGRCIECTDNTRCVDSKLARCDRTTNSCVGCDNNSDCQDRFPATPYCDKGSRRCVVCTTDGESTCGPGNFCDAMHTCAPGKPTLANCTRCNTNADCGLSPEIAVCAENNGERYCFAAAIGGMCEPGFSAQPVAGHTTTPYCLPPAGSSSCPAIASLLAKKTCTNKPDECGKNGVCSMPNNLCSMQCNGRQDCPAPTTCDAQHICTKP